MKHLSLAALLMAGLLFMNSCSKDDDDGGGNNNTTPGVASLNCAGATLSANPLPGSAFVGTATIPYTGGNGLAYTQGTAIASTGVTGLNATLNAGTLANGNGSLTYAISGTPSGPGTATFAITFGGQSCNLAVTINNPPAHVAKWYYDRIFDSAFCCLPGYRTTRNLTYNADSSGFFDAPARTYFLDLKADNAFSEYWFNGTTYTGNYAIGADTLRLNYSSGSAQRNTVQTLNATDLVFSDRSSLYIGSVLPSGDTLLSRYTFYMKK